METKPKLKPCPNCGNTDILERGAFGGYIKCVSCNLIGPDNDPTGEKWNALPRREEMAAQQVAAAPVCPKCGTAGRWNSGAGYWYCPTIECKQIEIDPARPEPKPTEWRNLAVDWARDRRDYTVCQVVRNRPAYPAPSVWHWNGYAVVFTRHERTTIANVFDSDNRLVGTGIAVRNPKDEPDARIGDRLAVKRACDIPEDSIDARYLRGVYNPLRPLYKAFVRMIRTGGDILF